MQIQDHVAFEQLSANGRLVSMIGGLLTQGFPALERGSRIRGSAYYVTIKLNHQAHDRNNFPRTWFPITANHALLCGAMRAKSFCCSGLVLIWAVFTTMW